MYASSDKYQDLPAAVPTLQCAGLSHITEPVVISGLPFDMNEWAWILGDDRPLHSSADVTFDAAGEIPAGTKVSLFTRDNTQLPAPLYTGPFPCNQGFFATDIEFAFEGEGALVGRGACTWAYGIGDHCNGFGPSDGTSIEFGEVYDYLKGNQNNKGMPLVCPPAYAILLDVTVTKTLRGTPGATLTVAATMSGYLVSKTS